MIKICRKTFDIVYSYCNKSTKFGKTCYLAQILEQSAFWSYLQHKSFKEH